MPPDFVWEALHCLRWQSAKAVALLVVPVHVSAANHVCLSQYKFVSQRDPRRQGLGPDQQEEDPTRARVCLKCG